MRNIYEVRKIFATIQQGSIFNQCISDNYSDDVYGIVITPRCDIGNEKVNTIHYLPIIKYDDWLRHDFLIKYQDIAKKEQKGKIKTLFKSYNISINILNTTFADIEKVIDNMVSKDKERNNIKETVQSYIGLNQIQVVQYECGLEKNRLRDRLIQELQEGRNKDFYLIEDWNDKEKYRVVLLREINRISFNIGKKISKGLAENIITDEELNSCDLNISKDRENLIAIEANMKSPFIEHLMQAFFHNFGRIGVDDFPNSINDSLVQQAINKFK